LDHESARPNWCYSVSLLVSDHHRLDQRSLALHRAVSDIIRRDPAVVERALGNLARWETTSPGPWIEAWRALLLGSRDELLAFLVERSERADRLRQSSPFAGVLSPLERRRIYESYAA
jgi:hypothetical protein